MLNVRLAGDHLFGKLLFTWLSLVVSMVMSFCAVLFPTRCLGWDLELNWVFWGFFFLLFCIGKSENYLFFRNYCSLRSQSCLKHSVKWVYEVGSVSKVKVILWPWSKITQISKLKLVFLKNCWAIWNQCSYESMMENRNENKYKWVGSHD